MTSTFFQRILLLVLLAGCMTGLHAQEYKYEIGGMAGGAFYMGDVNKNAFFKGLNPAFGAVIRYNPNFRWALKTNLMWGGRFQVRRKGSRMFFRTMHKVLSVGA